MKLLLMILYLMGALIPAILCQSRKCSDDPNYGKYDNDTDYESEERIGRKAPSENLEALWMYMESGNSSECPELYQRYSTAHTYCKKSTCDIKTKGITEEDKRFILDMHNSLRSKLASGNENRYKQMPPAANMMEMEWDDELALVAQAHANLCEFRHDTGRARQVENFNVGQNLMSITAAMKVWKLTAGWYKDEVCYYSPTDIHRFHPGGDYGHFTQLTWANTWKIGCGFTAYSEGGHNYGLHTCNYGPTGNIVSRAHYKVGEPCSQCPKNTNCSETYPGLCKSLTENGPQEGTRLSSDNYILLCDFSEDDPEECNDVIVTGSRNLTTRTIYTGDYKTVVLEEGESVTIDLGKARNVGGGGICPFMYSRFGPNNAADDFGSKVEIHFSIGKWIRESSQWNFYQSQYYLQSIGLGTDREVGLKYKLVVEEGAAPQYFDIQAWGIFKGHCRRNIYADSL